MSSLVRTGSPEKSSGRFIAADSHISGRRPDIQCLFAHVITYRPCPDCSLLTALTLLRKMIFDPNSNSLPKRSELPEVPGTPKGSAWFWGKNDEVGKMFERIQAMNWTEVTSLVD